MPKRKREGDNTKQDLLEWLYGISCAGCKVKYSSSVEVLAAVKEEHIDGRHSSARTGATDDETWTSDTGAASPVHTAASARLEPSTPRAAILFSREEEAGKVLKASPCTANKQTFIFQQPLIRVITRKMPANDKFASEQRIVPWMKRAIAEMIGPVQMMKNAFKNMQCVGKFGELQDRPHMSAVVAGLRSVMPASEQMIAQESPVKYVEEIDDKYVEKNPSPHELSSKNLEWVMDILMSAQGRIPRVIAECKRSLEPEDIYQAALGGARLCLDRLKMRLPIDRLYVKVWSAETYQYAILDVFGHVKVVNGRVTATSFNLFETQVSNMRRRCGVSFQEEAFQDAPTSVEEMEQLFHERDLKFHTSFGLGLPAEVFVPVGVLYISQDSRPFPTGTKLVGQKDACVFYQGMLRALGSNSILGWNEDQLEENIRQAAAESVNNCSVVD